MEVRDSRYEHWKIDLMTPVSDIARILQEKGGSEATQAHFFAYIGKDGEDELIKVNVPLLQNVSAAGLGTYRTQASAYGSRPNVRHWTLQLRLAQS